MVQQMLPAQPISPLVALVRLIDRIPLPSPSDGSSAKRRRGRPRVYPDRLFLKALVIMVLKGLPKVHSLLAVLEEPTPEMVQLKALLTIDDTIDGRYPSRRTFERRLKGIPETLPAQIACLGQYLVELLKPWTEGNRESGRAGAIDSTVLPANGGVWHKKHREAGIVPHTSIDTEAGWTRSGWHGFVYGWKLHLVVTAATIARVWIPLVATLTPANVADNVEAPKLLDVLADILRFVLGDVAYNTEDLSKACAAKDQVLVTTKRGKYPHSDDGVEVRRVFHQLRSQAIENFNGQFKAIFDCRRPVPTRGLLATTRFVLGAVFVYQLTLLHRFEHDQDLRVGLKPFLQAA